MNTPLKHFGLLLMSSLACASIANGQLLIAHRGASYNAPENTIAAFRLAWEQGADGVEGDFYLTKDGHVVCIHDSNTKRTGDKKLRVASSTLEELRTVDVGVWKGESYRGERIPTLGEVLAEIPPRKKLFLEVKCGPEIVPELVKALEQSSLGKDQVVVISFNAKVIEATRKVLPQIRAHLLTGFSRDKETNQWKPSWEQVLKVLQETKASGIDADANLDVLTPSRLAELRNAGYEIHCYTINDAKLALALQALGVDSITTDRPLFLRQCLEQDKKH